MDTKQSIRRQAAVACSVLVLSLLGACANPQKAPATADVAVSRNAVQNAVSAGAPELAPEEITVARQKMLMANQALAAKDYKRARALAMEAQADAQLAQSKASSAKATAASDALNADLRVLRQEVDRANSQ
jgi:F0F1-type ATP synthase epsilon subunit